MPVVLENRWSSQGRGGGVAHPLHPPPSFAPVCIHMYVDGTTFKRKCSLGYHHVAWNGKNKTQKLKGLLPPFPHAYHPLYYTCSEINLPRDIFFLFHYPEFSALLVPLIFSRKRGRYYHGDRRSWHSSRDNNIYSEESSSEESASEESSLTKL